MVFNLLKTGIQKVSTALEKTRSFFGHSLKKILGRTLDASALDELEELLYTSDLGVTIAEELTLSVKEYATKHPKASTDEYLAHIESTLLSFMPPQSPLKSADEGNPTVFLIVGVNGNGKTTSVARLGNYMQKSGQKVLCAGADTFRAAATEQLEVWAKKLGCEFVKGQPKSDPAAVAFDAISAAKARKVDLALIDTAGRLQTKVDLMQELEKIRRSCNKALSGAPHETLLVLDATTGQNALEQARTFNKYTPITGLILTKLDGTAKGGIALAIQKELKLPIYFIGTGEGLEDLEPFDPKSFVQALLA